MVCIPKSVDLNPFRCEVNSDTAETEINGVNVFTQSSDLVGKTSD